ncbi:MAG: 50S ribosomal protein L11 methyltransferase [Desulfobacterales bacterium]|nr:MAG: 50S ribosomal protein L11 methyltransferase [Desulfobacterales bacterium]
MKWVEVKIYFDAKDNRLASDLLAHIFFDCGLQGVVVEEPADESLEDWGKDAIKHEHYAVIGYIEQDDNLKKNFQIIEQKVKRFEKENGIQCDMVCTEIDEIDWTESWKDYFWPKKVSARVVIKPVWRAYAWKKDEIVVEIDPGMAFGTGTHPTTCLCIMLIEKYLQAGDSFLDVGTGSGILMIAAAKLGARRVCGTDQDKIATGIARTNLSLNMIPEKDATVIHGNLATGVTESFDVIAANVSKKVVFMLLNDAKRLLNDNGVLIISGITEADEDVVLEKMRRLGFADIETATKEQWVAMACILK